ncbi:Chitin synthase 3 [Yarrowia sp. B02]|nr:Chitin synthase 3 [Yarrowia sp. B02]
MGYTLDEVRRSSIHEPHPYFPAKTPSPDLSQRQFQVRRRSSLRQCLTPTDLLEVNYESVFDDDEKETKDESHPPTPTKTSPPSPRRTSLGHQSLVGSYEESLLSGRMSASTSKTVPFHAGIGVLGKGGCNKLLRCPKQINMSFNAGFVVWEDTANTSSLVSATGSPYVGIISLTDYYEGRFAKREKRQAASGEPSEKSKVKTFPGYRIPPVGQLQVVVSNLQKTAVKLFLIPYNVSEMPSGTRTFIRQKVYSAASAPGSKGTLVHAAHIPIARLDNGKLYMCGDVRLVFQNRVLNGGAVDDKASASKEPTKDNKDFTKHYLGLGRSKDNMVIEEMMGGWSKLHRTMDSYNKFGFNSETGEPNSGPQDSSGGPSEHRGEGGHLSPDIGRKKSLIRPDRARLDPDSRTYHYSQLAAQQQSRINVLPSSTGNDPILEEHYMRETGEIQPGQGYDQPYDNAVNQEVLEEETEDSYNQDEDPYAYSGRQVYGLNDEVQTEAYVRKSDEISSSEEQAADTQPPIIEPPVDEKVQLGRGGGTLKRHNSVRRRMGTQPKQISLWMTYCQIVTFWAPAPVLRMFGMPQKARQDAWREKIGLITVILYIAAFVAYLTFGFTITVCSSSITRVRNGEVNTGNLIINGKQYPFTSMDHPPTVEVPTGGNFMYPPVNAGSMDGSLLFQNVNNHCKGLITPKPDCKIPYNGDSVAWYMPCQLLNQDGSSQPNTTERYYPGFACHTSTVSRNVYYHQLVDAGEVYFTWDDIKNTTRNLAVFNGAVIDLNRVNFILKDDLNYPEIFDTLRDDDSIKGTDISRNMANGPDRQAARCLQEIAKVGYIDTEQIGCLASQVVLYVSLVFIISIVAVKFLFAIYYKWAISAKQGAFPIDNKQMTQRENEIEDWSENIYSQAPIKRVEQPKSSAVPFRGLIKHRFNQNENKNKRMSTMVTQVGESGTAPSVYSRNSAAIDSNIDVGGVVYDYDSGSQPYEAPTVNVVPQPPIDYQPFNYPLAHTMCLVTAYSESIDGLRTTLDSITTTDYPNSHKLIVIIADGIIKGSGNDMSTPDICLSMMCDMPIPEDQVKPFSYVSTSSGSKRHNMAKVYSGFYLYDDATVPPEKQQRVPVVTIVKCGTPAEANEAKPGNRGKRDSQIILMSFLQRVMFDERMTELEHEMFNGIWRVTGILPDFYEIILMVDADTKVFPDSLTHMVAEMVKDPEIMGLCGETKIANKRDSWVTAIQVFEYYISHHQAKAFESVFGGVTCLPGCFSMYRIKAPKGGDGYWVPILANPDIVERYADNVIDTLHKKNLLLLGEDRYLTSLMLKTFPTRKQVFVSKAVCKTIVPDKFSVLLSQRRRWINSTVHNLMELVLVKDLCGVFCISMQFVVFIELVGTLILPAAISFTIYVVIIAIVRKPTPVMSLVLLALILGLPGLLIIITASRWSYVVWMFIYLLSLPIWNFVLPVYAYWKFDDFSWGDTRQVAGEKKGAGGHDEEDGEFDSSQIVMKRWRDFEMDKRRYVPLPPQNAWMSDPHMPSYNHQGFSANSSPALRPQGSSHVYSDSVAGGSDYNVAQGHEVL